MMESDKKWVHKPESAYSSSTNFVLAVLMVVLGVVILGGVLFLKGKIGV